MKRILVISRGGGFGAPHGHQVWPFRMYQRELRERLDVTVETVEAMTLDAVRDAVSSRAADVAIIMVDWRDPVEQVNAMLREFRSLPDRPAMVFLDYYAPTCSPHFGVLPYVDVYVKRQLLRDLSVYQRPLRGGYVVSDFLTSRMGYDIRDWYFGSELDASQEHKLVVGWNLGVVPRYRRLLRLSRSWVGRKLWRWRNRPIDLNRRFAPIQGEDAWYARYRRDALTAVAPLEKDYHCSDTGRLSGRKYFHELFRSKIVLSPFGWGELCFRDYEAVACGALLMKPSMSHLETSPDIFVPNETYVETSWDLGDVEEKCRYYLSNPDAAERIVRTAQDRLYQYYEKGGFCSDIERLLSRISDVRLRKDSVAARERTVA